MLLKGVTVSLSRQLQVHGPFICVRAMRAKTPDLYTKQQLITGSIYIFVSGSEVRHLQIYYRH